MKKQYSYPKFAIRLSEDQILALQKKIERLHKKVNKGRNPKVDRVITKAQICFYAIEAGLTQIENGDLEISMDVD